MTVLAKAQGVLSLMNSRPTGATVRAVGFLNDFGDKGVRLVPPERILLQPEQMPLLFSTTDNGKGALVDAVANANSGMSEVSGTWTSKTNPDGTFAHAIDVESVRSAAVAVA